MYEHAHQCKNFSFIKTNSSFSAPVVVIVIVHVCICFVSFLLNFAQIFNNELFGAVAEEKEVKGIVSKLMEARHSKSMDSYELLAKFCSRDSITKLMLPLKEVRELGIGTSNIR